MPKTIATPDELFEHLDTHTIPLELSVIELATLSGVVKQAIEELGADKNLVRGTNEVSQRMIDEFWTHLYELDIRLEGALKALPSFDASALNDEPHPVSAPRPDRSPHCTVCGNANHSDEWKHAED